jgi:hypothetical protein
MYRKYKIEKEKTIDKPLRNKFTKKCECPVRIVIHHRFEKYKVNILHSIHNHRKILFSDVFFQNRRLTEHEHDNYRKLFIVGVQNQKIVQFINNNSEEKIIIPQDVVNLKQGILKEEQEGK